MRVFGVIVRRVFSIAAALLLAQGATAQGLDAPRPMALEDLHKIQQVSSPKVSPDGQWVAMLVATHQLELDITQTRIWIKPWVGGSPRLLNAAPADSPKESQSEVQWGPANSVFYLSDRGGDGQQVWRQALDQTEPVQVTHLSQGVNDFVVSPDGMRLALLLDDPRAPVPEGKTPPPFVTERFQFMEGDSGTYLDHHRRHLYVAPVATGEANQLTSGAHDEWLPSWSPDSMRIAYVSKRGDDPDRHSDFNVFVIEARAGAKELQLTDHPGADAHPYWGSRPVWSPDGTRIAYLRGGDPKWYDYAPNQLAVLDLATRALTLPASVDRFFYQPEWSADGTALYALREEAQTQHLVKVDIAAGHITPITSGQRYDIAFDIGQTGHMVLAGNGAAAPAELYAVEGDLRPLTQFNTSWLKDVVVQPMEEFRYRSAGGAQIHGLLVKPLGYEKGNRYPTVVQLHGGPVYQFSHEFQFEWQWWAAQGYAVVAINPRGSSGRGLNFSKAIYADWGNLDVKDVLAGVDHVVRSGVADPTRLVIGGHSYGSILTNFVIASDTRFKAATSSAGGNNMFSLYGLDQYTRDYEIELGTPWSNPKAYARTSYPFLHADRIKTPTLFLCGEVDFNVPCSGPQQMYQALRSLRVPTAYIRFPNQGHSLDVPSYLAFRLQRYQDWYQRFLKEPS